MITSEKTKNLYNIIIIARFVFNDGSKCCPQIFLNEGLYNLAE